MRVKRNIVLILVATAVCVIWIYVCPAALTYFGDVWDSQGVKRQLSPELVELSVAFPEKVQAVGFTGDRSLHIFFITYMSLFTILLTFQSEVRWSKIKSYFGWTGILYVIYQWPHYIRALVNLGEARRIYSCYHADVHFPSFLLQDFRLLGMVALFAVVLRSAICETTTTRESSDSVEQLLESSSNASHELTLWYIRSTLLAFAFVPFTYFYWRNIMVRGAVTFAPSAVMIHIIWLVIWYSLTARLLKGWACWKSSRREYLESLAHGPSDEIEANLLLLNQAKPTSDLRVFGSILIAATAFIAPILAPLFSAQ